MTIDQPLQATARRSDPLALTPLWLVVAWLASFFGTVKTVSLALTYFVLHRLVHAGPDFIWKVPLGLLLILAILALPIGIVRWLVRPLRGGTWPITLLGSIAGFDFGLNIPGIHPLAAAILGIGLGVQFARLTVHNPVLAGRWGRRTLFLFASLILLATTAVVGRQILEERRLAAALPPIDPEAPNVLLIILDTQRAMSMSAYGYEALTTPTLERLAASGVRFAQAYSTAPWTLPSHGSIMTGHWAHELSTAWDEPLDETYPTLAEELSRLGYVTGGFTANVLNTAVETGIARGFSHYEAHQYSVASALRSTQLGERLTTDRWVLALFGRYEEFGRKTAPHVSAEFLRWTDSRRDRPFFAFLNYFDAHDPYPAPAPFDSLFGVSRTRERPEMLQRQATGWTADQVAVQRKAYEASIAFVDHQLGLLFDELRARGRFDNTLIIVTSDHGEEFHEHGFMQHGNSLYRAAVHVPLIMSYQRQLPAGATVTAPVSLRALPVTIMDLLGAANRSRFPGQSLLPYVKATPPNPEPVLSWVDDLDTQPEWYPVHNGPVKSVCIGQHRYIVDARGREELYSINDPLEQHNLATDPAFADSLVAYRIVAAGMRRSPPSTSR